MRSFTGRKKRKSWNNTREKYMLEERRQNLAETDQGLFYNQEEWVEFLDDKGVFYNNSESGDGHNHDENCNENMEAVVRRCSSK